MTPLLVLAVALAGGLAALVRYAVNHLAGERGGLPWGIVAVNVAGSFIAGLAVAVVADAELRVILLAGLCGGLTTFSTLAVDSASLASAPRGRRARGILRAIANVAVTVVLGVGAAAAGFVLGGG
ncbi:fluoride efflux transporter FluC [Microcella flavibacter]|uniref:fluoride efflux transporter FluC n=1 Tax=Microcella flavibacter TaxID=1804990 RepID=UPI0014570E21|nr:CrcB family protein [Microcella flavibacter]